ncbi:MAG: hypothetical protein ACTSRY_03195 [Alphaproteobacteria bacterium]
MTEELSRDGAVAIVGDLGAERLTQIVDSGATAEELLEAKVMAAAGDQPRHTSESLRTEYVHRCYDILRADMVERE